MKFVLILLTLTSSLASAVTTKDCPQKLFFEFGSFGAYSNRKLAAEARKASFGSLVEDKEKWAEVKRIRDGILHLEDTSFPIELELRSTNKSSCTYAGAEEDLIGDNETRLFTRNGREIMRISLKSGEDYYWAYYRIAAISPEIVLVERDDAVLMGYFDRDSPVVRMGRANDLKIQVQQK